MASFGRSFKPASYLSSVTRRPGRAMSNSSDVSSPLSSPDSRTDDQTLSARGSPNLIADNPQLGTPPRSREAHWRTTGGTHSPSRTTVASDPLLSGSPRSTPNRSKPIAIELPTAKKVNSAPVYTPPAPLSARGDLPGGYFPLHEEQNRVYHPHPFQLDASKARLKSIKRASDSTSPETLTAVSNVTAVGTIPGTSTTAPAAMTDRSAHLPQLNTASLPRSGSNSRSSTPVTSYMPTGTQDNTLPMGKYYPSNYEKRKDDKKRAHGARPLSSDSPSMSVSRSDSQVPTFKESPTMNHSRNESEAKRRLQQYQRDMIAQATLALNGGNVSAAALNSLRTMGFSTMSKPSKPRLVPLGSPGPVTPMELEGSEDGYLGARGTANAQTEEIARAIRADEERKRREGTTSPAVELGPSTF